MVDRGEHVLQVALGTPGVAEPADNLAQQAMAGGGPPASTP
ncbi:hypothetical protein ACIBQ6_39825 [Nonomuraea sp. NPDC049655]